MALSNEDKGDVKAAFGKKVAGAVSKATHDGAKGKKMDMAKKVKSKDTRDSFMKGLDRHKDDAVMKGYI